VSPLSRPQYKAVMDYVKNQTWSKVGWYTTVALEVMHISSFLL
jgi:hypothetical protein